MTAEQEEALRQFDHAHQLGEQYVKEKDFVNQPVTVLNTIGFAYADGFLAGVQWRDENLSQIKRKYESYVANIEWHIKTNGDQSEIVKARLKSFQEIVKDLDALTTITKQST